MLVEASAFATIVNLLCLFMAERRSVKADKAAKQIDFVEWLNSRGYDDIAQQMELLIAQGQQLKDITEENHQELLEKLSTLKSIIQNKAEHSPPEIELGAHFHCGKSKNETGVFPSYLIYCKPFIKNVGSQAIKESCFEIHLPGVLSNSVLDILKNSRISESSTCIKYQTSLLFGEEIQPCNAQIVVNPHEIEVVTEANITITFRWDRGCETKSYRLVNYLKNYLKEKLKRT